MSVYRLLRVRNSLVHDYIAIDPIPSFSFLSLYSISQDIHEWGVIEKRQRQAAQQAQPPQVVVMPQSPHYPPPGSPIVMGQPMMKQ